MSTQWLTVRSFQQSQELLSAINALSIHIKLNMVGVEDREREDEAREARRVLGDFLNELERFVGTIGEKGVRPVTGADARTRQLARSFVQARRERSQYRSLLFRNSPAHVRDLLPSQDPKNQQVILECLDDLRRLLEAHIHSDAGKILGEI
ncbi:MAG: hypothetical protein CVU64_00240 [Deltaproteobacteria bacterium HGW-Deltaproteobacteria-21]|nr:MAG: hypothetical protein CVU64_00240 [Deltaproteobacteria bacterium HGW-Deltaproteobacteria-21]